MHGAIYVKSVEGEGSNFTFEILFNFPQEDSINISSKKTVGQLEINSLNNLKILLVEDNEFNQMLAEDTLRDISETIEIDIANNGKEAVDKAYSKLYDIILMDIQMPVMNVMREDIDSYFKIGMDAYISKPFTTENLVHKIVSMAPEKMNVNNEQKVVINKQFTDMGFLKTFTKNDGVKQKKYIELFMQNAPQLLTQADVAIATEDREKLKINAHSLKGQLNYFGVQEIDSKIYELEKESMSDLPFSTLKIKLENVKIVCEKTFEELNKYLGQLDV
jgi:CheY-like chemotaxis protein